MESNDVLLSKEGNVAVIQLNRPEAFNAFGFAMLDGIIGSLELCSDDQEVKAVILTGTGKVFCSGGDLTLSKQYLDKSESLFRELTKRLDRVIKELRTIPKPVIAAINGAAGGAALSIAAACDLRIAASSAKLRQSYTSLGLVPDGAWSLTVPLLVGFSTAVEMIFLDPVITAGRARDIGLVHQVVDDGELMDTAMAMARELACGPTFAFALAKRNLNQALFGLLERQLEAERDALLQVEKTEDFREAMDAFFSKRKPVFQGR